MKFIQDFSLLGCLSYINLNLHIKHFWPRFISFNFFIQDMFCKFICLDFGIKAYILYDEETFIWLFYAKLKSYRNHNYIKFNTIVCSVHISLYSQ